jgi:hypothetical protein
LKGFERETADADHQFERETSLRKDALSPGEPPTTDSSIRSSSSPKTDVHKIEKEEEDDGKALAVHFVESHSEIHSVEK